MVSRGFTAGHIGAHTTANSVMLGDPYDFMNTGDNDQKLAIALGANMDASAIVATINDFRANAAFPDMRKDELTNRSILVHK